MKILIKNRVFVFLLTSIVFGTAFGVDSYDGFVNDFQKDTPQTAPKKGSNEPQCLPTSCKPGYVCIEDRLNGRIWRTDCVPRDQATPVCVPACVAPNVCQADSSSPTGVLCMPPDEQTQRPDAGDGVSPCTQQFHTLLERCQNNIEETKRSCDEKNDEGMNAVSMSASQMALMMGQMSASSIQAACSKMAKLSQMANAALASYRISCSNSISDCRASCGNLKKYMNTNATCVSQGNLEQASSIMMTVDDAVKECNGFESHVAQANQAINNFMGTTANAAKCDSLNNGTGTPAEVCKANPPFPGCEAAGTVDCSKPEVAATNKICICAKNPLDPQCATAQKAGGGFGVGAAGGVDSSSRLANKGGGAGAAFGGDIPGLPQIEQGKLSGSSGDGGAVDGQQGSGSPLSGGGGGSGGGRGSGAGEGQIAAESAGGGGGGFYGGGGGGIRGGTGGGSAGGGRYGSTGAGAPAAPRGPDLRKFLPGGQYDPRRGISGLDGIDGITGPHSDIWQKIQNRYQVMRSSLLP